MHHLDFKETFGEKARWELHNDVTYSFEQILEAITHKTASYMTTYLPSHKLFK